MENGKWLTLQLHSILYYSCCVEFHLVLWFSRNVNATHHDRLQRAKLTHTHTPHICKNFLSISVFFCCSSNRFQTKHFPLKSKQLLSLTLNAMRECNKYIEMEIWENVKQYNIRLFTAKDKVDNCFIFLLNLYKTRAWRTHTLLQCKVWINIWNDKQFVFGQHTEINILQWIAKDKEQSLNQQHHVHSHHRLNA